MLPLLALGQLQLQRRVLPLQHAGLVFLVVAGILQPLSLLLEMCDPARVRIVDHAEAKLHLVLVRLREHGAADHGSARDRLVEVLLVRLHGATPVSGAPGGGTFKRAPARQHLNTSTCEAATGA
eukprot:CAMPEP_0183575968 /NCGR_PEP_ID=MMETSP0371-20130417/136686_1 /TAXON_ID=268820 /ORGANISM="Peridinium aciculiferum, Strain PAER-2" /LENGTH=123 /DNA_ID=CAMNT_0025786181 /DNA_START=189 /DNA_END=557 /DNA_ORIENTATION=+